MNRLFCLSLTFTLIATACSKDEQKTWQHMPAIGLSRVVEIPIKLLEGDTARMQRDPGALTITRGGEDELPQGPETFEVLDEGDFVVADHLRERLVIYDSLGQYRNEWAIGFAANSITQLADGRLELTDANTGEAYVIDERGEPHPISLAARGRNARTVRGEARLMSGNHGVISQVSSRSGEFTTLQVDFQSDTTRLISLQSLGSDQRGHTYVVLETSTGSDVIDVQKLVRVYDERGNPVAQILAIPIDYFVHPLDEFRIHDGRLYQLFPDENKVIIRIWEIPE